MSQIEEMAAAGAVSGDPTNALETIGEIKALLDDPSAFGCEQDVADLSAEHATDPALMDDEVFGAVPYRDGFYNTLFAGTVAARPCTGNVAGRGPNRPSGRRVR